MACGARRDRKTRRPATSRGWGIAGLAVGVALSAQDLACHRVGERRCGALASSAVIAEAISPSACTGSGQGAWLDLGYPAGASPGTAIAATRTEVVLGTTDGVWQRPLDGSGGWIRAGLGGRWIRTLLAVDNLLLAGAGDYAAPGTFHRSLDPSRADWCTSGSELFRTSGETGGMGIPVEQIVRDPGPEGGGIGLLYANLSGSSIAASMDGGASWRFVRLGPEIYAGSCVLHFSGGGRALLYQGCELVTDIPFVQTFDVSSRSGLIGDQVVVVASDMIGNRAPNVFAAPVSAPGDIYAGLEGALLREQSASWSWIFEYPVSGVGPFGRYAYIRAIWIDPCSESHLVFGGPTQARASFDLYETTDGGATLSFVAPPSGLQDLVVLRGVQAGEAGSDMVLLAATYAAPGSPTGFRVIVRHHDL